MTECLLTVEFRCLTCFPPSVYRCRSLREAGQLCRHHHIIICTSISTTSFPKQSLNPPNNKPSLLPYSGQPPYYFPHLPSWMFSVSLRDIKSHSIWCFCVWLTWLGKTSSRFTYTVACANILSLLPTELSSLKKLCKASASEVVISLKYHVGVRGLAEGFLDQCWDIAVTSPQ